MDRGIKKQVAHDEYIHGPKQKEEEGDRLHLCQLEELLLPVVVVLEGCVPDQFLVVLELAPAVEVGPIPVVEVGPFLL